MRLSFICPALPYFIKIDLLNDVKPDDIEDISERFIMLYDTNKDADTVKRIRLKDQVPLFVISIVEHQSNVNFRTGYRMLQYITYVLSDYEKEAEEKQAGISTTKDFMYPPVLPIVFYDGPNKWSAKTNFIDKTLFKDIFYKYIPKFEYELISLNQYSQEDLVAFDDTLSLIMLIDKLQTKDIKAFLQGIPKEYLQDISGKIPKHLLKLVSDIIKIFLTRINAPEEEIEQLAEMVYERRLQEMFTFIEPYDVQETRRQAKAEAKAEATEEFVQVIEQNRRVIEQKEQVIEQKENLINESIRNMLNDGQPPETIAKWFKIPISEIEKTIVGL
jgi:hypothetical protein